MRKTEDVVRKPLDGTRKQQRRKPAEIVDLERRFGDTLGTRVSIDQAVSTEGDWYPFTRTKN